MFCKNCGKEIDSQSIFCSHCGTKVQSNEDSEAMRQQQAHDEWRAQMAARMGQSKSTTNGATPPSPQRVQRNTTAAKEKTTSKPDYSSYSVPISAPLSEPANKKKSKHPFLGAILLIFGILLIHSVVFGKTEPQKVGDTGIAAVDQLLDKNFSVGDKVELDGVVVTLVSVTESAGGNYMTPESGKVFVICEFNIENNSSSDIAVSSLMSFEAYIDDYTTALDLSATVSSNKAQLDGTIAAGKKMNGIVGYSADEGWQELEIRFTPDFWAGSDIIFSHKKYGANNSTANTDEPVLIDDKIAVSFIGVEDAPSLDAFYVTLKIENKTDAAITINLENASVDGETIPLITTGVPLVIQPGNSGQTGFIFSMVNLSISSMSEAEKASFRVVARDNDTYNTVYESELLTVDLHQ